MTASIRSTALSRRSALTLGGLTAVGAALAPVAASAAPVGTARRGPGWRDHATLAQSLAALEREASVTIGVMAVTYGDRRSFSYRAGDLFPMCSLFKVLAAAALVRDRGYDETYWSTPIAFSESDIVRDSPILSDPERPREATPEQLADAAIRFSDNTAGNLLLRELGGPSAITAFAALLGATRTRLDRWEPELNEAIPGDHRDTTTPGDIARLYQALLLDDAAGVLASSRLREWMLRCATSGARMRAGLVGPYELADKTGGGDYGVVNDAGVLWQPGADPLTLVVLTRTDRSEAVRNDEVIARVTRLVVESRPATPAR
ncbi:class A beta-lactamase [Agromyces sp. G08B096]|uniref:Beta-lactamase n=1 Tax=Agromyces sp. G08B096 TaxID=3156399 RepID=A0AAU7W483_9MICO